MALTLEAFKATIEQAVVQHDRVYTKCVSVSYVWDDNNTETEIDVKNFTIFLRVLGFQAPHEFVIDSNTRFTGWIVKQDLSSHISSASPVNPGEHGLVFAHYAGHGSEHNGELQFTSNSGKLLNVERTFLNTVDEMSGIPDNVDVVFIFDSCYSYLATTCLTPSARVVEVPAATDAASPLAFPPVRHVSLTAKLANEVSARRGLGERDVELAELIGHLRQVSPKQKPVHKIHQGFHSIQLPIQNSNPTPDLPREVGPPSLQVVFSIHVSDNIHEKELSELCTWLRELPGFTNISVENAYQTTSTLLILKGSYSSFSKLVNLPDVKLICETSHDTLIPVVPYSAPLKENQRPPREK